MNTIISTDANKNVSFFATNLQTNEFELRFWRNISQLQQDNRWLCVVCPHKMPSKAFLESVGINLNRMLVIHSNVNQDSVQITKKALQMGKCATVVSWIENLSTEDKNDLIEISASSQANCIMVKPLKANKPAKLKLVS